MREFWVQFRQHRSGVIALGFLVLLLLACLLGPFISSHSQTAQDLTLGASPPSASNWFGTDILGRDVLVRVLYGGRISLLVGVLATLVAMVIGVTYGMVSGLASERVDGVMMRVVDILYSFPFMTFVIILMVVFGKEFWLVFAAIGAVEWLTMARVVRAQVLGLKKQEFVLAARTYGASFTRILFAHLLPNVLGTVIVYASLTVPGVMMLEAMLSFLGLGIQPPLASWGTMISEGAAAMSDHPWLLLAPAGFFASTLLALNTLGDALRDVLDPKARMR
ncbi:MAG: ABC transporter permease [Verrucomicrobiaceae bacterium]|nr:ABC transporter permease [Verrucomicrobiaceae bacterium]